MCVCVARVVGWKTLAVGTPMFPLQHMPSTPLPRLTPIPPLPTLLSHPLPTLQYKVVTVAVLSEKFKIGGSLARRFIAEQVTAGKLRVVSASSNMGVYSRVE